MGSTSSAHEIAIIGGGWSGLACAWYLRKAGLKPMLLEAAPQLGGRARSIDPERLLPDNGQHLLIGAYHETLALLGEIGLAADRLFERRRLSLTLLRPDHAPLSLKAARLPAPLHLLGAILLARGMSGQEKRALIAMAADLARQHYRLPWDRSVASLCAEYQQPKTLIQAFWEPLCLATLNTPVDSASAQLFLRVLQDAFSRRGRDSDLLIPRTGLSELFAQPMSRALQQHGVALQCGQRVQAIEPAPQGYRLRIKQHPDCQVSRVVLATPFTEARRLLPHSAQTQALHHSLARLTSHAITTVYLQYPAQTRLGQPMVGVIGTLSQWVFDHGYLGRPGLMAVVISASDTLETGELTSRVVAELARLRPHWPTPLDVRAISDKQATFAAQVGVDQWRPGAQAVLPGLWLCGDYLDTGYPATLEGAIRAAQLVAQSMVNT